jgi:drug/metabolite transporter (DMT)-like permease
MERGGNTPFFSYQKPGIIIRRVKRPRTIMEDYWKAELKETVIIFVFLALTTVMALITGLLYNVPLWNIVLSSTTLILYILTMYRLKKEMIRGAGKLAAWGVPLLTILGALLVGLTINISSQPYKYKNYEIHK